MDQKIKSHFKKVDPILFKMIGKIELVNRELPKSDQYFEELCDSIISQQLAGKAAETIFNRFKALFPKGKITSAKTLRLKDEDLRKVGLSRAKATYIKDLALRVENGELDLAKLQTMADEEIIDELVKLKGIGRWTAEMFLMFTLGREDIFSTGDLGLNNAIVKLYGLKDKPTKVYLEELSFKWSPYRSLACRILWKSLTVEK